MAWPPWRDAAAFVGRPRGQGVVLLGLVTCSVASTSIVSWIFSLTIRRRPGIAMLP